MSLRTLARSAWRRPRGRELVFTPLPFSRVLLAWVATFVVVRVCDALREGVLLAALGSTAAEVVATLLAVVSVLAITQPLFRMYAGQWTEALSWYAFLLVLLTVLFDTFYLMYVDHQFSHEIIERYNVMRGSLWPLVLVAIGATPFLWTHSARS